MINHVHFIYIDVHMYTHLFFNRGDECNVRITHQNTSTPKIIRIHMQMNWVSGCLYVHFGCLPRIWK